jgi:hypothetical protein
MSPQTASNVCSISKLPSAAEDVSLTPVLSPAYQQIVEEMARAALNDYHDPEIEIPDRLTLYRAKLTVRALRNDLHRSKQRSLVEQTIREFFGIDTHHIPIDDLRVILDQAYGRLSGQPFQHVWHRQPA